VGEVSSVNDDTCDNRFLEELPRFPAIEEDEPVRYPFFSEINPVSDEAPGAMAYSWLPDKGQSIAGRSALAGQRSDPRRSVSRRTPKCWLRQHLCAASLVSQRLLPDAFSFLR